LLGACLLQVLPQIEQLERENEALKQQSAEQQPQQPAAQAAGYDVKSAPRELLEEDLLIARSHLLPRMEQLAAENEALRQQQQEGQGE
jgi:FtsZ-binding cell division protein ZapB